MDLKAQLILLAPETLVLGLACLLLVVDTFSRSPRRQLSYRLGQVSLLLMIILVAWQFPDVPQRIVEGHFVSDSLGAVLKIAIGIVAVGVFFYAHDYLNEHGQVKGEFYVLGLFAVLGMMVMCSAGSLLTVYLGLELLSLSLYSMVAMNRDSPMASEAAMKYFVLGALASGMLLYGMSMLYGTTGTLDLQLLAGAIAMQAGSNLVLTFGLVFVIVGIAFKLGAVPFHMWVPDVYEGSPTAVTLFIASAPKIAAFAMAIRLLVDGMQPLVADWQGMLIILSLLSMAAGNLIAISQSNIKRMLAYSTIAHVGFLLLGILAGTPSGYAGSMFYIIVYALMSMGSFGMVILLGRSGREADKLDDFTGLARRSQWFAFVMLVLMFSMAGVPPFIGFWAKWFVILEVIAADQVWLAALAVVFSVIGAYYYLRIVKLMYFDEPDDVIALRGSREMQLVLSLNGLAILLLGLVPGALMAVCLRAME
jgi:NADH-quinone oxidoreductase subunit N